MNYIDKVLEIIKDQFVAVMSGDPNFYSKYNIVLSNEQQFVEEADREPNTIYIVVKFLSASLTFGQTVLPVNFNAVGEQNAIDACQRLLLEYAQEYTLKNDINISTEQSGDGNTYIIKQIYQAPQVMNNFNGIFEGFRTLFYMSGTFLIGKNSLPIEEIRFFESADETGDGEKVEFINTTWDFNIQLDSQAFYGTNSRTVSKSKIGTLGLSATIYLTDSKLSRKILGIAFDSQTLADEGIKEKFYFTVKFANNVLTVNKMEFHLVSAHSQQNLGELPLISLTFTN